MTRRRFCASARFAISLSATAESVLAAIAQAAAGLRHIDADVQSIQEPDRTLADLTALRHCATQARGLLWEDPFRLPDNLLSWADSLYRRETRESIGEATQLYVLAALGPKPASTSQAAAFRRVLFDQLSLKWDDRQCLDRGHPSNHACSPTSAPACA